MAPDGKRFGVQTRRSTCERIRGNGTHVRSSPPVEYLPPSAPFSFEVSWSAPFREELLVSDSPRASDDKNNMLVSEVTTARTPESTGDFEKCFCEYPLVLLRLLAGTFSPLDLWFTRSLDSLTDTRRSFDQCNIGSDLRGFYFLLLPVLLVVFSFSRLFLYG